MLQILITLVEIWVGVLGFAALLMVTYLVFVTIKMIIEETIYSKRSGKSQAVIRHEQIVKTYGTVDNPIKEMTVEYLKNRNV